MATLRFYIKAQTGNNASSGLSLALAVKTPERLATILTTVYDDFDFEVTYSDIAVEWYEFANIASGASASTVVFHPGSVLADIVFNFKSGSGSVYGTLLPISSDGYQTHTLVIPAGCTIEGVEFDPFMTDTTHVDAKGFEMTFGDLLGDSDAVMAAPGGWFHDGVDTLHANVPFGFGGYICVRYRPSADVRQFELSARGLTVNGPSNQQCWFLYPMHKSDTISPYGWYVSFNTSFHDTYTFKNFKIKGTWHSIGILGSSLEVDTVTVQNVEFTPQCVSDSASLSYNPLVIYSSNATGTEISPVYLDITDWLVQDCWVRCKRPLHWDGDTLAGGLGGESSNNSAQFVYAHGANAFSFPRIDCPATSGVSSRRNRFSIDDMYLIDPYFAQRTYQSHTDTPHTDAAWGSFAEDLTIECWRVPQEADAATLHGQVLFNNDCNIRLRRCDWEGPDCNAAPGAAGSAALFSVYSTSATDVFCELESCKFSVKGHLGATARSMFQLGSAGSGTVVFRALNCDFIQAGQSLSETVGLFDVTGGSTAATIEVRSSVIHSNSPTGFRLLDDATTGQLPLYSSSTTRCVFEDNHYSNVESFDTATASRDSSEDWRTGAEGPHDGTLSDGNGRHALYGRGGQWNPASRKFRARDLARTSRIHESVTLSYEPATGLNGVAFTRTRGADQFRATPAARQFRPSRHNRIARV